jgi:L-glyceraldehyde 3-phosphate reductase
VAIAERLGTPILIHQPSYSLLNRWIEPEVVETCDEHGLGIIAFSPLGQGMLTDRYLEGIPGDSRAAKDHFLKQDFISEQNMARVRALNEIASRRGQALAQLAIAWVLRDPRVTSALIGASSVKQLETNVAALENLEFSDEELAEIDRHAVDAGINIWEQSSEA